ncbi:catalase-related immune-responsive protein, partial [Rhizoctonia solani AG-3 Rhs1AP]
MDYLKMTRLTMGSTKVQTHLRNLLHLPSAPEMVDFEQPRALWQKVMKDDAKERFVNNVAGHLGGAKSAEIKARQLSVFAAVDQDLSDRIAKAMGVSTVKPLQVKPASEAIRFKAACAHGPFAINKAAAVRTH